MSTQEVSGVSGHLTVEAVYDSGEREVLVDRKNHIVVGFLRTVSRLITQKPTEVSATEFAINSLWVEASDSALVEGVTSNDEGPEGVVVHRYIFDRDSDVDTEVDGVEGLVEFRGELPAESGNDETIRAVGLYSQGDDANDPSTSDNVHLVARQLVGSIPKTHEFSLEFTWRIQIQLDD